MENLKDIQGYDYQSIYNTKLPTEIEVANKLREVIVLSNQNHTDVITLKNMIDKLQIIVTNLEFEKEAMRKLKS